MLVLASFCQRHTEFWKHSLGNINIPVGNGCSSVPFCLSGPIVKALSLILSACQ